MVVVFSRKWRGRRRKVLMRHEKPVWLYNTAKEWSLQTPWLTIVIGRE